VEFFIVKAFLYCIVKTYAVVGIKYTSVVYWYAI